MAVKKKKLIDNKNGTYTYDDIILVLVNDLSELKISDTIYIYFLGTIVIQTYRSRYERFETELEYEDYINHFINHFIKDKNLYVREPSKKTIKATANYDI